MCARGGGPLDLLDLTAQRCLGFGAIGACMDDGWDGMVIFGLRSFWLLFFLYIDVEKKGEKSCWGLRVYRYLICMLYKMFRKIDGRR